MTKIKVLARDFPITINTGTTATPVRVPIEGVSSETFNFSKTDAETNDFDSNGWMSHLPAMRGLEISLDGQAALDKDTKEPLPGQAAVEAASRLVGYEGLVEFQFTRPSGRTVTFTASVQCTPFGGGTNDAAKWTATLKVDGEPDYSTE